MFSNFGPEQSRLSRLGLVYGASFSRAAAALESIYSTGDYSTDDIWYSMERFQLDHINEVLEKLEQGAIDDEIWGKIIIMERGKRLAKAYLRKTTIIVDGGEDEFDGKTLGFNHFSNPQRDEYTEELRFKIGDGVIIKMDTQGNIKAMARGSTPIIVQGWKEPNLNCLSERLLREQGKLKTCGDHRGNDEDRIAKIFDMRRFKSAVSRELTQPVGDAKELLMKSCVRISLVKDCSSDPMKTPCWFMIINLVALDMLKTKLPQVLRNSLLSRKLIPVDEIQLPRMASQTTIIPPPTAADVYSQAALTQIFAAAVQQANTQQLSGSVPALHQIDQIARLASSLALTAPKNNIKHEKRAHRRSRSFSDSDDSSSSQNAVRERHRGHSVVPKSTTSSSGSSSGVSGMSARNASKRECLSSKSLNAVFENEAVEEKIDRKQSKDKTSKNTLAATKLGEMTFDRNEAKKMTRKVNTQESQRLKDWLSCTSTTSDYDSNREPFESGSWSSTSRRSSTNSNLQPCESPQLLSEGEHTDSNTTKSSSPLDSNREAVAQVTDSLTDSFDAEIEKIFEEATLEENFTMLREKAIRQSAHNVCSVVTNSKIRKTQSNAANFFVDNNVDTSEETKSSSELFLEEERDSNSEQDVSKKSRLEPDFSTTPIEESESKKPTKTVARTPTPSKCKDDKPISEAKPKELPPIPPPPPPPPLLSKPSATQIRLKTKSINLFSRKQQDRKLEQGIGFAANKSEQTNDLQKCVNESEKSANEQKQSFTQPVENIHRERRVSEMVASIAIGKSDDEHEVQIESSSTLSRRCDQQRRNCNITKPENDEKRVKVERSVCLPSEKPPSQYSKEFDQRNQFRASTPRNRDEDRTDIAWRKPASSIDSKTETNCAFRSRTETGSTRTETEKSEKFRDGRISIQNYGCADNRRNNSPITKAEFENGPDSTMHRGRRSSTIVLGSGEVPALADAAAAAAEIALRRRRNGPWDHLLTKTPQSYGCSLANSGSPQIASDDEVSRNARYRTRWKTQEVQPFIESRPSVYRTKSPSVPYNENRCRSTIPELPPPGRVAARISAMEKVESTTAVRFRSANPTRTYETSKREQATNNCPAKEWRPHSVVETGNVKSGLQLSNREQKRRSTIKQLVYYANMFDMAETNTLSKYKDCSKGKKSSSGAELEHVTCKKQQQLARPLSMWCGARESEYVGSPYGRHVTETPYGRETTTELTESENQLVNRRVYQSKWRPNSDPPIDYDKNDAYISHMAVNEFRPLPPPPPPTRYSSVHVRTS